MSYQSVLADLKKKYNILDCIDLQEFEFPNTGGLFTRLCKFRDFEFKENERLIIIADRNLLCTFDDMPPDVMVVLQQYIHFCNIAHYFVLVLSNIDSIGQHLVYLQNKYYRQEDQLISYINV